MSFPICVFHRVPTSGSSIKFIRNKRELTRNYERGKPYPTWRGDFQYSSYSLWTDDHGGQDIRRHDELIETYYDYHTHGNHSGDGDYYYRIGISRYKQQTVTKWRIPFADYFVEHYGADLSRDFLYSYHFDERPEGFADFSYKLYSEYKPYAVDFTAYLTEEQLSQFTH